jgi:methionyl-tRNA synthetase
VTVPGDKTQVIYVWCDALTNYLTGIGYPNTKYKKFWPADIHTVGKDMLRFHAGIWSGMLLSASLPLPKEIIVHGFLTINGQKISKSLGNIISPSHLAEKYSADALRYFLMRSVPFGQDGDFSEKVLIERNNNELANKLGNLVSRVSTLAEKYGLEEVNIDIHISNVVRDISELIERFEFDKALNEIFAFIDTLNQFAQDRKPWKTKNKKDLFELVTGLRVVAILLWPFIPETSEKIAKTFNFKISLEELDKPLKISKIKKAEPLFKKI